MKNNKFRIEIYFPDNKGLSLRSKIVEEGTTLRDFLREVNFNSFNNIDTPTFGVFGKIKDLDYVLREFDRVEVYHDASRDPKKARLSQVKKNHKP